MTIEAALDRPRAAQMLGYSLDQFDQQSAAKNVPPPHQTADGLVYWWEHEVANAAPSMAVAGRSSVQRWLKPCVYFMGMEASPYIKIGWAVNVPRRRLDLQCACPERLRVVASVFGDLKDEKRIHRILAAHRSHGEWFRPEQWMEAVLRSLSWPMLASHVGDMLEATSA